MIPLFIIGAPRSGSTFFTTSVNRHPQAFITNELRAWSVVVQTANRVAAPSEMLPDHPLREAYAQSVVTAMVNNLRVFYRDQVNKTNLGCSTLPEHHYNRRIGVFGDKNPGYADPNNKGCLDLIARSMPGAKFIHVYRDPRSCAASYLDVKVYADDIDTVARMWRRHVVTALEFGETLNRNRFFSVRYEDWVSEAADALADALIQFLKLDASDTIKTFLENERASRTPYRAPTTPTEALGRTTFADRLTSEQIATVEEICAPEMKALGYELMVSTP